MLRLPEASLVLAGSRLGLIALALAGCGVEAGPADEAPAVARQELVGAGAATAPADDAPRAHAHAPRPATLGADFIATPHGWRHRSCVIEVGADETVRGDRIERADGTHRSLAPCAYPAYDRAGRALPTRPGPEAVAGAEPQANGFVSYVTSTSTGPVNALVASWTVPPSPRLSADQVVFLFPGLEPLATGDIILQPVLAWNGFEDGVWTISSWACCAKDNGFHSAPITVAPDHLLTGTVVGKDCDATGVCPHWTITTRDDWTGLSTSFASIGTGEPMDWVFGGALEVFGVDTCDELPRRGRLRFEGIVARSITGQLAVPVWQPVTDTTVTPDCQVAFGTPRQIGPVSSWGLSWTSF
jgi:hypothetical protein